MYIQMAMKVKPSVKTRSIAQARNELPHLIHEVERGAAVRITRRGQPVAFVVSTTAFERGRGYGQRFAELYSAWLRTVDLERDGVDPEFFAPLRDRSSGRDVKL